MMSAHLVVSGMWFQGTELASPDSLRLLVVFVGVIAAIHLFVFLGLLFGAFKVWKSTQKLMTEVKAKAFPVVASVQTILNDARPKVASITENVRGIVEDVRPKIASVTENVRSIVEDTTPKVKSVTTDAQTISANFVETTNTFKDKAKQIADNVSETVGDANKKTRAQVDRVDNIVSSAFNATSQVAAKINHGIRVPVNEVVGWVNGMKAGIDKLFTHKKPVSKASSVPSEGVYGSDSDSAGSEYGASHTEPETPPAEHGVMASSYAAATGYAAGEASATAASGRAFASERFQAAATRAAEQDLLADPSSAVPPSPGAQEVVDRFLHSADKTEKPKAV